MLQMEILAFAVFLIRLFVGGVFLIAGLIKIKGSSSGLLIAILGYELVPRGLATILAYVLPWLEIIVGGLLILGLWSHLTVLVGAGLLAVFLSGIVTSLLRGMNNDCGCYQSLTPVQWKLAYRNLIIMGLLLPIYLLKGGMWSLGKGLGLQADWQFQITKDFTVLVTMWVLILSIILLVRGLVQVTTQIRKT
jgi:uncharacterized membrane protein YphA (DoxX/SURF4 family)